jgi:hypothetical protein
MTHQTVTRKKATLHVSIEPALSDRLRTICERMGLPLSHFASLALSREAARFESEFVTVQPGVVATRSARP